MKHVVAMLAGWFAGKITKEWALRLGLEPWASALGSWAVGATVSAAVLRA